MARCGDQVDRPQKYYRFTLNTDPNSQHTGCASDSLVLEGAKHTSAQTNGRWDPLGPHDISRRLDQHDHYTRSQPAADHVPLNDMTLSPVSSPSRRSGAHIAQEIDQVPAQHPAVGLRGGAQVFLSRPNTPLTTLTAEQDAVDQMVKDSKWAKEQHPSKTKDAATPGIYGKKKFCTYWIRTGNCDYVQEGCKYLHVIPDEETRLRIGIRDMPRWAKEDIPAPQHDFPQKQRPTTGHDWRRQASRSGQVNELPEISRRQTRPALPPPAAPVMTTNTSPLLNHTAQPFPPSVSNKAQQHPISHQSPFNSGGPPSPLNSANSSAAESFQRQMESVTGASQSTSSPPDSAAHRYSPATQPPISRPVNGGYRAPDKMEHLTQAQTQGQNQQQAQSVFVPTNAQTRQESTPKSAASGRARNSLDNHPALSPLPRKLAGMSIQSPPNTPFVNGFNGSAATGAATLSSNAPSILGNQAVTGQSADQPSKPMRVTTPTQHAQSLRALGSGGDARIVNQNFSNHNDAVKRMINGHIMGNVNGKPHGQSMRNINSLLDANLKADNPPISSTSPLTAGSVVMHRRHFVAPGEPEYVASTVEAEKAPTTKKNGNGGQKKRPRGRGANHADLI